MVDCEGDIDVFVLRFFRFRVVFLDWFFCFFCQKKKYKSCRELLNVRFFDVCQFICYVGEIRNDENMLLKIYGIDFIVVEVKYYKVCRFKYVSKLNI